MSRKFLTVFALVALLVAAMAGSAFAATKSGDIVNISGTEKSGISMKPISLDKVAVASGDLYYLEGAKVARSYDIELMVQFDDAPAASVDGWILLDISADGVTAFDAVSLSITPISKDSDVTAPNAMFAFEVSFDKWPEMISLEHLAVSSDARSADIQLITQSVPAAELALEDGELVAGSDDITDTIAAPDGFTFAGAEVRVLSDDGKTLMGYASEDKALSFDFIVSSDGTGIKIEPTKGGPVGEVDTVYHFALVNGMLVKGSGETAVRVRGIETSADMIASFDVVIVAAPDPSDAPSISLSGYEYNYRIGTPFKTGFTVTAANCEVVSVAATPTEDSTQGLAEQVNVSYVNKELVFDVAAPGAQVTAAGTVYYQLAFTVSADGVLLQDPIYPDPSFFTLNAANGYISAGGTDTIFGGKGFDMNVVLPLTYDPPSLSADLKDAQYTVRIQGGNEGEKGISGNKEATWKGVKVAFDAANQKYTFSGTPTEEGVNAWVEIDCASKPGEVIMTTGLDRSILIADTASEVKSGIQVDGKNGTGMTINKPNTVAFPLRSGDMAPAYKEGPYTYTPSLQVSGPDVIADVNISASSVVNSNGTYKRSTGVVTSTVTPAVNGAYYFDASYLNSANKLVMERAELSVGDGHHSNSGCDAGFGVFALLALAGAATLLRRKG